MTERLKRRISYELYSEGDERLVSAIVTEHLTGDLSMRGARSGELGGLFLDMQSVVLARGREQNTTQTFTANTIRNYSEPEYINVLVFVKGFGGQFMELNIRKSRTAVYINGDSGLDEDGKPKKICDAKTL